jgi:hypothetical protein
MRFRLQIAAVFIAVGLGALTVTLLYDPGVLVPHPPYGRWILERAFALASLFALGLLLVLDLGDGIDDLDDTGPLHQDIFRRLVVLAFLISALACAVFIAVTALTDYLDRVM